MIKAIIFDIDGVLIDSFESNLVFFNSIFEKAGYPRITRDQYRGDFHMTMMELIDKYIAKGDIRKLDKATKIGYELLENKEIPKITEGSSELIKRLSKKYKLGIVTGRIKEGVDEYMDYVQLQDYFQSIIYFGMYKNSKPDPEPILLAVNKLGVKPEEAVYVGDTFVDVSAAKAAGVQVILYGEANIDSTTYRARKMVEVERILTRFDILS